MHAKSEMSFLSGLSLHKIHSVSVLRISSAARLGKKAWKQRREDSCGSTAPSHTFIHTSSQPSISTTIALNDGVQSPVFGLGVYQSSPGEETRQAVLWAVENGYKLIDTAARYNNEESVGDGLRLSATSRESVFVVTKVYDDSHGYNETVRAFHASLKRLKLDYVDMYLIHSPIPDRVVPTWEAMVDLKTQGLIRSIGVSNFNIHHLEELKKHSDVLPSVNQIEVHPFLQEKALVDYCTKEGIAIQAYSPLIRAKKLENLVLNSVARQYNKTPVQVLLRWCIQKGFICIPKSAKLQRIKENADIFDFSISEADMRVLDGLDEGFRTGRNKIMEPWRG